MAILYSGRSQSAFFCIMPEKSAMQLPLSGLNNQLLPEDYFRVYYITDARQKFEFKQSGKYSLLSISFTSKWLDPLKNNSRMVATFLEKAKKRNRQRCLTARNR